MGLRGYIVKRIIYTVFLIVFVLTLNFIIFEVMPHNPLEFFTGAGAKNVLTPEKAAQILKEWGFDQPWPIRYGTYMLRMLSFQFGNNSPNVGGTVLGLIMTYLPNTLILMGLATVFSIIIGVVLGVIAAFKRGGLFDSTAVLGSLLTFALPTFWIGLILIAIFSFNLRILPANLVVSPGMPPWNAFALLGTRISLPTTTELMNRISHLIMPCAILTIVSFGGYTLLTRATMLESLTEDYVLTAKAKGLKDRTIIFKHALKNASLPIITSCALAFGGMIGGAMITETVFTYEGIGWLTIYSIQQTYNMAVLQAIFYIIALCVIFANFVADLLYGVIDPRIKYG